MSDLEVPSTGAFAVPSLAHESADHRAAPAVARPGRVFTLFGSWYAPAMGKDFYHADMQFFVDQRVDWARYVRLKRGQAVNPGEEVATYRAILQSIGEVCEAIESESHGHWYDEVRLEGGRSSSPRTSRRATRGSRTRGCSA